MPPSRRDVADLFTREMVFRTFCRHRQGPKPNILLYCARRGGSTWLLNMIAAHPGVRYVGRPFLSVLLSRWWRRMPDLAKAAHATEDHDFRQIVGFTGAAEERFRALADDVISGRMPIYPSLAFRSPYFQRRTDRIVFQMTSGGSMIDWFDAEFPVTTAVLFRHPIPTASSSNRSFKGEDCLDFLLHRPFVEQHLTGEQVDLAHRVIKSDDIMAHQVLDWTLKMLIPYRALIEDGRPNWTRLCYEHMVLRPETTLELMRRGLDLPEVDIMREQMSLPSRTVSKSTVDQVEQPEYLISRWRDRVDEQHERELLNIPLTFGIELYVPGRDQPVQLFDPVELD